MSMAMAAAGDAPIAAEIVTLWIVYLVIYSSSWS